MQKALLCNTRFSHTPFACYRSNDTNTYRCSYQISFDVPMFRLRYGRCQRRRLTSSLSEQKPQSGHPWHFGRFSNNWSRQPHRLVGGNVPTWFLGVARTVLLTNCAFDKPSIGYLDENGINGEFCLLPTLTRAFLLGCPPKTKKMTQNGRRHQGKTMVYQKQGFIFFCNFLFLGRGGVVFHAGRNPGREKRKSVTLRSVTWRCLTLPMRVQRRGSCEPPKLVITRANEVNKHTQKELQSVTLTH